MAFTDMDETEQELGEQPEDEQGGGGNRPFIMVAAILGAITLLALLCTAVYVFAFYLPAQREKSVSSSATVAAQETMLAYEATQAAVVPSATATKKSASIEAVNTPTPVVAEGEVVFTATPTLDSVQATQDALETMVAAAQTQAPPTATRLPEGGFADDVGAPGLVAMAVILVVVIFLVRRLRTS